MKNIIILLLEKVKIKMRKHYTQQFVSIFTEDNSCVLFLLLFNFFC